MHVQYRHKCKTTSKKLPT